MKRAYLNKFLALSFVATVLSTAMPSAQAVLPCGFSICWEQPEITHSWALGDPFAGVTGVYFTGVNARASVNYEEENVYDYYDNIFKDGFYSLDGGGTWSEAWSIPSKQYLVSDNADTWEPLTDMAVLAGGRYVFVWNPAWDVSSPPSDAVKKSDVYFNILDVDGGIIRQKNRIDNVAAADSNLESSNASVSALSDGGFIVTWQRNETDRSDIYYLIKDVNGNGVGGVTPILVNDSVAGEYYQTPKVIGMSDGGFVITATRTFGTSSESHVVMRRYSPTGSPINPLDQVDIDNLPFKSEQQQVEELAGDRFVVIWRRTTQNESINNDLIFMRIYDKFGAPEASQIQVNVGSFNKRLENPRVKSISPNSFIASWILVSTPGDSRESYSPYYREFNAFGIGIGAQAISTTGVGQPVGTSTQYNIRPIISTLSDGSYLIGFSSGHTGFIGGSARRITSTTVGAIVRSGYDRLGKIVGIPGGGIASNYYGNGNLFLKILDANRKLETPAFQSSQDVDLRFKLVDPVTGGEWYSPPRSYIYLPENHGEGGTIDYPEGVLNYSPITISFSVPCESCQSIQVYQQNQHVDEIRTASGAWVYTGTCPTTGWETRPWVAIGDGATIKTEYVAHTSNNGTCHKYRVAVTNIYGNVFNVDSDKIVVLDTENPDLRFSGMTATFDQLTIKFLARDFQTGIEKVTYQIDDGPEIEHLEPLEYDSNDEISLQLTSGTYRIRVNAYDWVGNSSTFEESVAINATVPEITISGIEDGGVYGSNAEFLLNLTQPLTDVVILVDGVARNNLIGLADGVHTLTVQGRDAFSNLVTKTVTFTIDSNIFAISLLSPQQKTYESNALRIQYSSSQPLTDVWYSLNGGPQQRDLSLSGLADGNYTLQLFGQKAGGATTSVTKTFSVLAAIPVLQVDEPREGASYESNQITVSYLSDSPVSYQFGDQTGIINTGGVLTMPTDGDHSLLLTATHPVSGYVTSQRINFKTDSVIPTIDLQSPAASYYPFTEIPIEYSSNKPLTNIQYLLDEVAVSGTVLTQLGNGTHSFQIVAEDSSGRSVVSERVQFAVSHLEIVRPLEGDKVLSDTLPPILPFEYAAEGTFSNFSYALDNGTQLLITDPPGAEISIPVAPGDHEILLRGTFNEFKTVRRAKFRIGSKNIAADSGSIDYEYLNCNADQTECDVNISIKVSNIGDFDIADPVEVRFDHIGTSGYFTENRVIAGMLAGSTADIALPTMRARLGDTFSLTLDPFAKISGEWPNDNQHQLRFQSAQITDIRTKLPEDNAYFQDVSVFEMVKVETAGPVAMVEYRLGDWTFVDDTAADGFESLVDLGLLSLSNSCMQIVAFGGNGVALDSRSQCFTIKRLALDGLVPMKIDWTPHESATNRVNINLIDRRQLAIDLAQERSLSLLRNSSIVPNDVREDGGLTYMMISNPAGAQGRPVSRSTGLVNTPIIGDNVPMPNGHGTFFTVADPNANTCLAAGVIPKLTQPQGFKIAELFQDELANINAMGNLGLSPLEEMARIALASVGIPIIYQEVTEISIGDVSFGNLFSGYSFAGGIFLDIPSQLVSVNVGGEFIYGTEKIGCRIRDELNGSVSIVANAKFALGIKDGSFDLSTGRFSAGLLGLASLDIAQVPFIPPLSAIVYGSVKVYPQRFHLPLEMGAIVNMSILDEKLSFGPAQSHFQMSINHNTRLAKADIQAYPLIFAAFGGLGLGAGAEFKADLRLNGIARADWVGGSLENHNEEHEKAFNYSLFDGSLVIKRRLKVCFVGICYKRGWKHFDTPYLQHEEGGTNYTDNVVSGIRTYADYTDEDIAAAVEEVKPFITIDVNDLTELGLYSIITGGDEQTSQDLLSCGLFQTLITDMSHSPLYEFNGESCQTIQSADTTSVVEVYSDPGCLTPVPYTATSFWEYCQDNLLAPRSEFFIGNANAWPDNGDPRYASIGKNSRWTLSHGTRLDVTVLSQKGNRRPFMKKAEFRNSFEPIGSIPQHEGCSLEMRVYKQDVLAENLKPLMFIHGGAWKFRGFGAAGMQAAISHLTERGYIVFTPYYRLMVNSDGPVECQGATGQQIISDGEAALDWVKLHGPALGASTAKITLVGQSAGATISSWLAVHDTYGADILKSVLIYPPTDLEYFVEHTNPPDPVTGEVGLFGDPETFVDARELAGLFLAEKDGITDINWIRENPSAFVRENGIPRRIAEGASFAPMFVIHGNEDGLVPIQSSTRLCDAVAGRAFGTTRQEDIGMNNCGAGSELHIIDGADHILDLKCFAEDINPWIIDALESGESFDTTILCPSGRAGAAPARMAIEAALEWLN